MDGISQPMNTYIQFYDVYSFPMIPKGFILETREVEDRAVKWYYAFCRVRI